jgi:hypothetical protein
MPEEKRNDPRMDFKIRVIHNGISGMTSDVSLNGTFIRRDEDIPLLPIGSNISFSLCFPNIKKHIDVKGLIVHHGNSKNGMGVWFKKTEERSKVFISRFISDYQLVKKGR